MGARDGSRAGALLISLVAIAALAVPAAGASAWKYKVLHHFSGGADGQYPDANLTFDSVGNLYGTTENGGNDACDNGCGVVFRIAPDGTYTVLYRFGGAPDGAYPEGGVTVDDATGMLTGTTSGGGSDGPCASKCGTIYQIAADGTETVLHSFDYYNDGATPLAALTRDDKGNLFGVANDGGGSQSGTIFEYKTNGKFSVVHSFGSDFGGPYGPLLADGHFNLYGTASRGGYGAVFELARDGTLSFLYQFTGGSDGREPGGSLARDKHGNLYGTTQFGGSTDGCPGIGCGVVYRLAPNGTETVLRTFVNQGIGGYQPFAGVVRDSHGVLYGVAAYGGPYAGTLYSVSPRGKFKVLHNFRADGGSNPLADLTMTEDGVLYGTASGGGKYGDGVVFRLSQQ